MAHRGGGGELGVRDVEEVGAAEEGGQLVPGRDMRRVVVGVPVGEPVGDRDRAVGGDREDPYQLLQIRAVVLGVPVGDHRGGLASAGPPVGVPEDARDADRGGVVVQLGGIHGELGDHAQDELGKQAGPVGVEQRV